MPKLLENYGIMCIYHIGHLWLPHSTHIPIGCWCSHSPFPYLAHIHLPNSHSRPQLAFKMLKPHLTFLHPRASLVYPHCFGAPNFPLLQRRDRACMRGTTSANHPQKCAQPPQHPRLLVLDDAWKPTNHQETMWANTKSCKLVVHHKIGTRHNILNQNNKQFPL
jgi:hypothetical protein